MAAAMDEDSIGWFGAAFLVAALIVSHPQHSSRVGSLLDELRWQDVVDAYSCKDVASDDCYLTMVD